MIKSSVTKVDHIPVLRGVAIFYIYQFYVTSRFLSITLTSASDAAECKVYATMMLYHTKECI